MKQRERSLFMTDGLNVREENGKVEDDVDEVREEREEREEEKGEEFDIGREEGRE